VVDVVSIRDAIWDQGKEEGIILTECAAFTGHWQPQSPVCGKGLGDAPSASFPMLGVARRMLRLDAAR
jgi:hypothetical protein